MSKDDNVIALADRVLGECPVCRRKVLFAENFVRVGRAFAHLSCVSDPARTPPHDFPRPAPPLDPGA